MSFQNVDTTKPDPRVTVVNCPGNSQCGSFAANLGMDNRGYLNVALSDVNRAVYIYLIGSNGVANLNATISCSNSGVCASFGSSVAGIGDFNDDGWFPDIAIGANSVKGVYMLWNGPRGFQSTDVSVSYGPNGGLTIKNSASPSSFGYPVVGLTDFNGDNIPDMAVGDRTGNNLRIFKGKSLTKTTDVADRSQPVIWMTIMESYPSQLTFFSYATINIPDMDGDSCSEIATSSIGRKAVYIIRGQKNAVEIRTASLNNPTYGANITDSQGVQFGVSIALAKVADNKCRVLAIGDNADGLNGGPAQRVSMVNVCGFTSIDVSRRLVPRFTSTSNKNFALRIESLCDLNGDMYPDLGIADPSAGTFDISFLKQYMLDLPVNTALYTGSNGGARVIGSAERKFAAFNVNLGVVDRHCTFLSTEANRFFLIRTEEFALTITRQPTSTTTKRGTLTRRPTNTRMTVSSTRPNTYTGEFLPTRSLDSTRTASTTPTRTASQTRIRTRTKRVTMSNSLGRTATPIRTRTTALTRSTTRPITPTHLNTRTTFTPTHTSTRSTIPSKALTTTRIATRTPSHKRTATSPTRFPSRSITRPVTPTGRPTFTKVPTPSHSRVLTATHPFTRTTPSEERTGTRVPSRTITRPMTRTDRESVLSTQTHPATRTTFHKWTPTIKSSTNAPSPSVTRPVTHTGRSVIQPTHTEAPTFSHSRVLTATHPFTRTMPSEERTATRAPSRTVTPQVTRTGRESVLSPIVSRGATFTPTHSSTHTPSPSSNPTSTHPFTRTIPSEERTATIGNSPTRVPSHTITRPMTRTDRESILSTRTRPETRTTSHKKTATSLTRVPSHSITRPLTHTGIPLIQRTHTKAPTFSHSRALTATHPFTIKTPSEERTATRVPSHTVTPLVTRTDRESVLSPIVSRGATFTPTHSSTHSPSPSSNPTSTHPFMRTTPSHKRTATSPTRVPSHTATRMMTRTINRRVTSLPTVSRGATLSSTDNNTPTHNQNNVLTTTLTQSTTSTLNPTTTRSRQSSGAEKTQTSKTRLLSKSRTITLTATDRSVRKHSATVVPSHTSTPNQTKTRLSTATPTGKNNVTPVVVVPSIQTVETRGAASSSNLMALWALVAVPVMLLAGGVVGLVLRRKVKRAYQGTHPRNRRDTKSPRVDGVPRPSGVRHFPSDLGGCATAIASITRSTLGRSREQAMRLEPAEHTGVEVLAVPSSPAGAAAPPLADSPAATVVSAALFGTPDGPGALVSSGEAATTDDVMLATAPPQQPQSFLLQMPEGQPPTAPGDPTLLSLPLSPAQSPTVNQPAPAADQSNTLPEPGDQLLYETGGSQHAPVHAAQAYPAVAPPLDALSLALANVALPPNPAGTPIDPVLDEPAASPHGPAHITLDIANLALPPNTIPTPADPEAEGTEPTPPPHSPTMHVVQVGPAFPADSSAAAVAGFDTVTMATGSDPTVIQASPTQHHSGAFPNPSAAASQAAHSPPASPRSGVLRLSPRFRRNQGASPAPYTTPVAAAGGPGAFPLPNSPTPSNPLAPSPTHSLRSHGGITSRVASPAPPPAPALPAPVSQLTVETVQGPGGQELQSYSPRHRMPARTSVFPPPPAASTAPTHPASQPLPMSPATALPPAPAQLAVSTSQSVESAPAVLQPLLTITASASSPAPPAPPMSPVTPPPSLTSPVAAPHAGHQAASPRSLLGAARESLKVVIQDRAEETELIRLARQEAERNLRARAEPGMKGDGWVHPSDTPQDPQDPSGETGDPGGDAL